MELAGEHQLIVFTFNKFFIKVKRDFNQAHQKSSHVQRIFFQGHGIF